MSKVTFISAVIILAVAFFGAVEEWAIGILGILIVVYFNYHYRGRRLFRPRGYAEWMLYAGLWAIPIYTLLQVLSLPEGFLGLISPSTMALHERFSISGAWNSISLCPQSGLYGFAKIFVYLLLFYMASEVSLQRADVKRLFTVLVVFSSLLSVFAIIQYNTFNGKIYWFRELTKGGAPFGPFVNRNHFAGFVGMVIPIGIALSLENRSRDKRMLLLFLSLVSTLGLFYSLSRGGIVSFLLTMAVFMVVVTLGLKRGPLWYLMLFLGMLLLYLLYLGISPIIDRFAREGLDLSARMQFWRATIKAIGDFPVFGTGLGTYRYVIPMYYPLRLEGELDYAHNDYLQLTLEMGCVGLFFILVSLAGFVITVFRYIKLGRLSPLVIGLLCSLLYIFLHSLVEFNLHIPSNSMLFAVIAGSLYGLSTAQEKGL